jgi:hypothetical protein
MRSGLYRVFIRDPHNATGVNGLIRVELENLFQRVCEHEESHYYSPLVLWTRGDEDPAPHELIVYLLPSSKESIIKKQVKGAVIRAGKAGRTIVKDSTVGNISEIYLDHGALVNYLAIAKMAFHELMHNKLQMGDEMHSWSNGGGGLADEQLFFGKPLSIDANAENIELMAKALHKSAPQFKLPPQPAETKPFYP